MPEEKTNPFLWWMKCA